MALPWTIDMQVTSVAPNVGTAIQAAGDFDRVKLEAVADQTDKIENPVPGVEGPVLLFNTEDVGDFVLGALVTISINAT